MSRCVTCQAERSVAVMMKMTASSFELEKPMERKKYCLKIEVGML